MYPIELYGYKNTRSFIFIDDAVDATIKISKNKIINQIFNIGSNKESKIFDVAKLILKLLNIKNKKIKLYKPPKGSVKRRSPDISKIKKIIGNFNNTSLKDDLGY